VLIWKEDQLPTLINLNDPVVSHGSSVARSPAPRRRGLTARDIATTSS
jgi:hypothetical protein